jgi:hypothetical protein
MIAPLKALFKSFCYSGPHLKLNPSGNCHSKEIFSPIEQRMSEWSGALRPQCSTMLVLRVSRSVFALAPNKGRFAARLGDNPQ